MVGLTREQMSDPLGALAAAAGYDDAERWWEDAIEQRTAGDDVLARFAAVRAAMAELRAPGSEALLPDRERLLRREAAMRKVLRDVIKTHDGPVVFVCGAFHAPVLHPDDWPTQASDNALLKGLPRTKVAATWAPWTSARLAYAVRLRRRGDRARLVRPPVRRRRRRDRLVDGARVAAAARAGLPGVRRDPRSTPPVSPRRSRRCGAGRSPG